jgi:hypothetical protein
MTEGHSSFDVTKVKYITYRPLRKGTGKAKARKTLQLNALRKYVVDMIV